MKLITFKDIVNAHIDAQRCMEWVGESIKNKADVMLPPKVSLNPGADGVFCNFMPGIVSGGDGGRYGGVKMITRYPKRRPALDSKLLLFDADTGETLALMDADWITAMRTGAVAAHSIGLFAKPYFTEVSIMGLGNAGCAVMLMLAESLNGRDVNVRALKYKGQEERFSRRFAGYENLHFSYVDSYDELVRGSEVVISAVTYLANDICGDDCFDEGVLVVPVHTRGFTNCDLFFDKVFADDRGHVCHFKNFEKFRNFAEVSDVVSSRAVGRESDAERILVYNIGVSMHDIAFASRIYNMIDLNVLPDINLDQPVDKFWV